MQFFVKTERGIRPGGGQDWEGHDALRVPPSVQTSKGVFYTPSVHSETFAKP